MGTHIFSGGNGEVSQVASAWTFDPAANVKLKTKGKPGTDWHKNSSAKLFIPLGTIKEHGTEVVNRYGAMDTGLHNPVTVLVGLFTNVADKVNRYQTFVKTVTQEAGEMVVHGVTTLTNAILTQLSPALAQTIQNGSDVLGGMTAEHLKGAALEEVEQMMAMLKDPSTYTGIAVSMAATAVQGVPVIGQVVGGAVAADRVIGMGQAAVDATAELQDIMKDWGKPMTPDQQEAARKRLAAWMVGGGMALLAALAGKKWKRSTKSTDQNDKSKTPQNSDQSQHGKGPCDQCALPRPVIISSGEKLLDEIDFQLPGPIPIQWRRRYRSGHREASPWGQGWTHPFAVELRLSAQGMVHVNDEGRYIELPHVLVGQTHFHKFEKFTLHHPSDNAWVIEYKGGLSHHYRRASPEQWRLQLFGISDRNGNAVRLLWSAPGALQHAGAGRTWSANLYGPAAAEMPAPADPFVVARLVGVIDSAGRELRLRWASTGDADSGDTQAHEDAARSARIVSVELMEQERYRPLATYQYDSEGQLIATHHAGEPYRQYAWRSGVLVGYRKASGHRFFAQYDQEGPQGRVLRSWCADAPVPGQDDDRFEYRPQQRVTLHRDGLNRVTRYHWDERFNIISTVVAAGTAEETRIQTPLDANANPSGSVDPMGRRTTYLYDQRGNLTQLINPLGHSTQLSYNHLDLVVSLKDALGHAWLREYDDQGNLIRVMDPLAQTTDYSYDKRGLPVEVIDAKGGKKTLGWDEAGNLTAYTDCSRRTTRFEYNPLGQLTVRTDALGQSTQYHYDGVGRLVRVSEPDTANGAPVVHQYAWNGEGQLLAYTDPLGGSTRYTYDGDGRPLTRMDAAGRTLAYHYDAGGRLIALVNENGAQTTFRYDLRDQLTDEIGFDGRWQRYVYNPAGELTHVIEVGGCEAGPGKVTQLERDALGRLLTKRAHAERNDAGKISPQETTYAYDALGRLTQADNGAAHLRFAYDPLGQLISETQTLIGQGGSSPNRAGRPPSNHLVRTLDHGYDPLGNRTDTTLPDGRTLNWLFYGSGHLHQINIAQPGQDGAHQVVADIERDALHREVGRSQGHLASSYQYDPAGRLTRHRVARAGSGPAVDVRGQTLGSALLERAYAYDAAGQLIARADSLRGRQDFRYDPTGRILAAIPGALPGGRAAGSYNTELFAFDPAGNLLPESSTSPGRTGEGVIFDNRLRFYQDLHFEYDVHGNVIRRTRGNQKAGHQEVVELRWNADHQLIESTSTRHGVSQTTRYAYDALGRRVSKSDAFGSTCYLWDGDLMIHSQRGVKQALYVYETDSFIPLATVQGAANDAASEQTYWYQCDQIGSPQELTDERGHIAWAADYKVWGEAKLRKLDWPRTGTDGGPARGSSAWPVGASGSSSPCDAAASPLVEQPFRFQGQQFDEETGLHYNRFRYYDPGVGRFASQDPIGLLGGFNLFRYATDPLIQIDPLGLAGAEGTISSPNIPGGQQTGLSTGEGGGGINNPAVKEAYDKVPGNSRSPYHGHCAEADAMSKAANAAGVTTLEQLKVLMKDSVSKVWRRDGKMRPMSACPSCSHVQEQLGIKDDCKLK
ncbi:DUF6531 domain-containing protein [Acidovorax sp. LjRoot129]|uniref:RHS repeat-associated core domain-containing protein n=1 Tax=Acidovorax sp. LjRoot129 TaxID=3342260 RepID=UPI003ED01BBB